jgi:hypothetical protein
VVRARHTAAFTLSHDLDEQVRDTVEARYGTGTVRMTAELTPVA